MKFKILSKDTQSKARTGKIKLERGTINTPIFMPVGTLGTVRGVHQSELINDIKSEIILGNTYHLYLRPKLDVIKKAGGIHNFINYHKPILTDSGGYQVYSLSENRKISEEGVKFQSHIDGSSHFFTPESAIDIQREIGADIIMAFDECTPYPCDYNYVNKSIKLTKVSSEYFSKIFFAKRPNSENLMNKELNKKGLNLMRPWKQTLREYLKNSYSKYL